MATPTNDPGQNATPTGTPAATATETLIPTPLPTSTPRNTATPTSTPSATPCEDAVPHGDSHGLRFDLSIVPFDGGEPIHIEGEPQPATSGETGSAYSRSREATDIVLGSGETGDLLTVDWARSTVHGERDEHASSTSEAVLSGLQLTSLGALLSAASGGMGSRAVIEGSCCTGFSATGTTTLVDAVLECLLLNGVVELPVDPDPNTVVVDGAGIRIVVNEQTVVGDALGELQMVVNAMRVTFSGAALAGLGVVSGEIVVGHSKAGLICESRVRSRPVCVGDCNNNHIVAVNELVTGVGISLRQRTIDQCENLDENDNSAAAINELVKAVGHLLYGCPE